MSTTAAVCHDCGVPEGHLHKSGCDMEKCIMCGGQLITCKCFPLATPPNEIRVPFILYPNICMRCGKLQPEMFSVPDGEWSMNIELAMSSGILCRECYEIIKDLVSKCER